MCAGVWPGYSTASLCSATYINVCRSLTWVQYCISLFCSCWVCDCRAPKDTLSWWSSQKRWLSSRNCQLRLWNSLSLWVFFLSASSHTHTWSQLVCSYWGQSPGKLQTKADVKTLLITPTKPIIHITNYITARPKAVHTLSNGPRCDDRHSFCWGEWVCVCVCVCAYVSLHV